MESADAWAKVESRGGYGPLRRADAKNEEGIVFNTIDVEEEVRMEEGDDDDDEEDGDGMEEEGEAGEKAPYEKPQFKAVKAKEAQKAAKGVRRIMVPPHRYTPLKNNWMELLQPLVENMKLQVRMNTRRRCVELRNSDHTEDIGSLQKAADFMKAFMLGFEVQDAIALLRLDDLFIESFEVKDVKRLNGDHLARCIGRLAGKDGKTKYAIENATRTRIQLVEDKIHILGSFANIKLARDSICSLILGSSPGKVYTRLRTVAKRMQERV